MPLTPDERPRNRYRADFARGKEPPPPRTEANRVLLEEVRAEVEQGKAVVRDNARKVVKRIQEATATGEAQLEEKSAKLPALVGRESCVLGRIPGSSVNGTDGAPVSRRLMKRRRSVLQAPCASRRAA